MGGGQVYFHQIEQFVPFGVLIVHQKYFKVELEKCWPFFVNDSCTVAALKGSYFTRCVLRCHELYY